MKTCYVPDSDDDRPSWFENFQPRQFVFGLYCLIAVGVLAGIGVLYCTVFVRTAGFEWAGWLWNVGVPTVAKAVHADPWLLLAFMIAGLFAWSFPWEHVFSGPGNGNAPDNLRRGRRITGSNDANLRAYQELLRRRTAKHPRRNRGRSRR